MTDELEPTHVDAATGIPIYAAFEAGDGSLVPVPLAPIGQLHPHPRNAREGDVGAIATSIRENGFFGVVQVQRSTGWIVAGNHRTRAAESLGMVALPRLVVDVDDEQALRMLIADNRTADLASYDERRQAALLVDMQRETERGLAGTGWDDDELDRLLSDIERPAVEPPAAFPTVDPDTMVTDHRCPSCGYEWSGKSLAGADPDDAPPPPE